MSSKSFGCERIQDEARLARAGEGWKKLERS
jgi:hypothetical protein